MRKGADKNIDVTIVVKVTERRTDRMCRRAALSIDVLKSAIISVETVVDQQLVGSQPIIAYVEILITIPVVVKMGHTLAIVVRIGIPGVFERNGAVFRISTRTRHIDHVVIGRAQPGLVPRGDVIVQVTITRDIHPGRSAVDPRRRGGRCQVFGTVVLKSRPTQIRHKTRIWTKSIFTRRVTKHIQVSIIVVVTQRTTGYVSHVRQYG